MTKAVNGVNHMYALLIRAMNQTNEIFRTVSEVLFSFQWNRLEWIAADFEAGMFLRLPTKGAAIKDVRSKLGFFDHSPPCPSYDVTVTT